jgi:N-acetylglucosamine transport system permease protein
MPDKNRFSASTVVISTLLILWSLIIIYPLLWTFLGSFKDNLALYDNPWGLPKVYHFENYIRAWSEANIGGFFFNSIFVTLISVTAGVFFSVLAAYIVCRFPYRLVKAAFHIMTISMMLPLVLTLVPKFMIMQKLGLIDSHLGLIMIYIAGGIPFGVFTMEAYFHSLPIDFEESAYLDGASPFRTFISIILPVTTSGTVVVSIFLFLRSWNEVYHAMILLLSESKYTIPLGMIRLIEVQQYSVEWGPILAGVTIAVLPILLFYFFSQRKLISGLTEGGLKG